MEEKRSGSNAMEKVAAFIVDKRNLFFLLYIFAFIFCIFSRNWVQVENDITTYLSEDTETRQGLDVMNSNFITYGTARVMVSNVSYAEALELEEEIEAVDGVQSVSFDDTEEHYTSASALFDVTFDGVSTDEVSINAMNEIRRLLSGYDLYVSTEVGKDTSADLQSEMSVIVVIAAIIIVVVLTLTSQTYAEVPVLLITFVAAALLNMGTNFLCGTISFISNSVTVVLQLALAIDYAIILCHRFSDEHQTMNTRDAAVAALSKAIPEISSSSLTTISGLAALAFMNFGIGLDLAKVLIKAILLSLLSVFTLMPGLLVLFSRSMERTKHKNLIPRITAVGIFDVKTRFIIPPIFVVVMVFACYFANQCPYVYTITDLVTAKQSETQIAYQKIKSTFGYSNTVAIIVPVGDYDAEGEILEELEGYDEVRSATGLANIEAMDGYVLTDSLTARQFSEMVDLDYEVAVLLYTAYAANYNQYGEIINGVSNVKIPLYDMFMFLKDQMDENNLYLDGETQETLNDLFDQLDRAQKQLKSDSYSRLAVTLRIPEESEETFLFLDKIHEIVGKYYDSDYYIVGNSTSAMDLSSSFSNDNLLISILSALFVIIILLFTFKSAGLPVLLILVIQGSIWMNFSVPTLQGEPLYFLGYLIVNAIQMGANIDYAIVISSHYTELKQIMKPKEAIVATLNEAFPTIFTSGTILASAGMLIGQMTTNAVIAAIGDCLGRGTIISMLLVLLVLPQILLLGDTIIEKTSFEMNGLASIARQETGTMRVNGRVRGHINALVDAEIHGVLHGQFNAAITTSTSVTKMEDEAYLEAMENLGNPGNPGNPGKKEQGDTKDNAERSRETDLPEKDPEGKEPGNSLKAGSRNVKDAEGKYNAQ